MNAMEQEAKQAHVKEQAGQRQVKRQNVSLTPSQLLTRLENIHRLGRKDVPQQ